MQRNRQDAGPDEHVYTVQGGQIVEIRIFEADQYAVDELLTHA